MEKLSASFVKVPPRAHLLNLVTSTATEKYILRRYANYFTQIILELSEAYFTEISFTFH